MIRFSNFTNNFVGTYSEDNKIRLYDLDSFAHTDTIVPEHPVTHFQYTYDDQELFYACGKDTVHRVQLTNIVNKLIRTQTKVVKQCFMNWDGTELIFLNGK